MHAVKIELYPSYIVLVREVMRRRITPKEKFRLKHRTDIAMMNQPMINACCVKHMATR